MNTKEMDILTAHFDRYFEQDDCVILHPTEAVKPHIDALLYKPNEKYPFWKLCSMGAGDFKMNAPKNSLGNRNEYIMAVGADEDMNDPAVANRYFSMLLEIAMYPYMSGSFISYGHSIEWQPEEGEEMVGAFIELPQIIEDPGVLQCKMGAFKTVTCLMPVLINRAEMDRLINDGPESFSYSLFSDDGSERHFLSELRRSDKF